jgi:hypothetical protein
MRSLLLTVLLTLLAFPAPSDARTRSQSASWRTPRSCHCDRYTNPHYNGYVPRTHSSRRRRVSRY